MSRLSDIFQLAPRGVNYRPTAMQYNSSYLAGSGALVNNAVTFIGRIKCAPFTGAATLIPFSAGSVSSAPMLVYASASDVADTDLRNRLKMSLQVSSTEVVSLASNVDVIDNEFHNILFAYDGTAGVATFIIDGNPADNIGWASRVAPTVATITKASCTYRVGSAWWAASNYYSGQLGFLGLQDSYITDYSSFFDSDGNPQQLDTSDWSLTPFGTQPLLWNEHGDLRNNLGSFSNFTDTGVVYAADIE